MSSLKRPDNDQKNQRCRPLDSVCGDPMAVTVFLPLAVKICQALAALHCQGLIHGNINPHTILIDPQHDAVTLSCLSSSASLPDSVRRANPAAHREVLPPYMSPEQSGRMNRPIDQRSDLYSLGVVFYQLLTGRLPFQADDLMEWVHCHIAHPVRPPGEVVPQLPEALSLIVVKLLAKSCEDRYQSAEGVAADLKHAHRQWRKEGTITPFELGKEDISERLLIPYRLYGRAAERNALLESLRRVASGSGAEVVMVSGYAGIGKTSLVLELYRPVAARNGFFITGKFDPLKREVPYQTAAEALRGTVRQMLSESEERICYWRQQLQEALGGNARLLIDLMPQLELIIGPQPEVSPLPPAEAQNRFHLAVRHFISVVARRDHPLVVFLDDLQWADQATLKLIEQIVPQPEARYLLIVCAYRANEVGAGHPILPWIEALRRAAVALHAISLRELSRQEVGSFLAEAVCTDEAKRCDPLAQLVYEKTGGNPFFVTQFLTSLYQEGLLHFDRVEKRWVWDIARIRDKGYTDNVVDLMVGKLKKLSPPTLEEMRLVSCIGSEVDVETCAVISGVSRERARSSLAEAAHEGLLVPTNDHYAFLHDKVQEAAYSLVPQEQRAVVHLKIGRLLVTQLSAEALEERIFDVVNQLNLGSSLIADPKEKASLSRLNAAAGRKAMAAVAFDSAAGYLQKAVALLPPEQWGTRYQESFSLFLALAQCQYLSGLFPEAQENYALLLNRARSNSDRAQVLRQESRLRHMTGEFKEALALTLRALAELGVSFPEGEEALLHAFAEEMEGIGKSLSGRSVAELANAPAASDPQGALLIALLTEALASAYAAAPAYYPIFTAKAVSYSLRYGNTIDSCIAYGSYAVTLIAIFGEIDTAVEFSQMALVLVQQYGDQRMQGLVLICHAGLVAPWRRPIASTLPLLERAVAALLSEGDFVNCAHVLILSLWAVVESGAPLDEVACCAERYRAIARKLHNETIHRTLGVALQLVASLQGETSAPALFDADSFSEEECRSAFAESSWTAGLAYFHLMKLVAAVVYRRFDLAQEAARGAEPAFSLMMAMPAASSHAFFQGLTLLQLLPKQAAEERKRSAQTVKGLQGNLAAWTRHAPENFLHREALLNAELARVEGKDQEAARRYEQAIEAARTHGFLLYEALSLEFAAHFYRARGLEHVARYHLAEARDCYARCGAHGKTRQLEELDPWLARQEQQASAMQARFREIDAAAVLRASQAISGEIVLDALLTTLMRIMMENSGAQRGALLLTRGDDLEVELLATQEKEGLQTARPEPAPLSGGVPLSVVNYVRRTREPVLLDNAAGSGEYTRDPYIVRHQPLSLLCLPIVRQAHLVGLLYLENRAAGGVFTGERVAVLEVLATQAAISLDNALLYDRLQQENRERTLAEEKFRALVENAPDAMVIVDTKAAIAIVNTQAERLFGYSKEELLGHPIEILLPEALREQHVVKRTRYLRAPRLRPMGTLSDLSARHKDGRVFPVDVSLGPITTPEGVLVTATVRDMSEAKRGADALRESEQRYRQLAASLEERVSQGVEELTRKNRMLLVQNRQAIMGEMISIIAHQWRQPLNTLGLLAQELQVKYRLGEAQDDYVEQNVKRSMDILQQLSKTIDDFRFFFRPPHGKITFNVLETLRKTLTLLKGSFEEYGIKTRISANADPEIQGYPTEFSQVLLNILLNAKDAFLARQVAAPQLLVEVREQGAQTVITITDNAGGIAEEIIEKIFEPYFTTKGPEQGTGVGLFMCKTIIEKNMNGSLRVRNVDGGAQFIIEL